MVNKSQKGAYMLKSSKSKFSQKENSNEKIEKMLYNKCNSLWIKYNLRKVSRTMDYHRFEEDLYVALNIYKVETIESWKL